MTNLRTIRRMSGFLNARLPELRLSEVADHRKKRGKRWQIGQLLRAMVVGLLAGRKSLAEVEKLTAEMSSEMGKMLKISRRIADTTLRDFLCAVNIDELRAVLHRLTAAAHRRKAIAPVGLPFGVIAMDGKATAIKAWDESYSQRHHNEETGHVYGLARTMTVSLTSAFAKPCIDVLPIPSATNEMGAFAAAFLSVRATYGKLFSLVTYDAGASSDANGALVVGAAKHYLFRLKNEAHYMLQYFQTLLSDHQIKAETVDVLSNKNTVRRTVRMAKLAAIEGDTLVWSHARTVLRVSSTTTNPKGVVVATDERFYVCSLESAELNADQWLLVVRSHWAVENNVHHTLDVAFGEDDKPFITYDPQGTMAVFVLRRIALSMLALFRSVTLRAEENKKTPWRDLMRSLYNTVVAASAQHTAALRLRHESDLAVFS